MNLTKILILVFLILSNNAYSKEFEISDFEELGFKKETVQFYQIIGAIDGWSGKIDDERLEVYIYENEKDIPKEDFENQITNGNASGWKEACFNNNLALLTKGTSACKIIKQLK